MSSFTANELAEFHYQKANIYTLAGSYDLAEMQYKLAYEADQKDRYRLGYIESKFKLNDMPSADELKLFIEQLNNDSYHKCIIKAKCLVLLNKNEEALTLLRDNYPENIVGQMVVCTMSGMVDELHNIIDANREREFQDAKDSYHFNAISARRCFYQATHGVISNEEILPIQGKVEYDLRLMQDAHSFSQKAWLAAKELGYPGDITILLDISILVYGYFDALPELIEHFDAILVERPNHPDLIGQYSRVLFNRSEYHRVIELIDNLEAPDAGDYGIKILSYYNLGKNSKVLELIDQHEEILLDSSTKDIQMIFCVAAEIAKELLNPVLSERYETIAKSFHDGEALVAIRKFVSSGNANPARKKELTQELYNTFIKLDKPNVIAEQLFRYLDAYEVESAKQLIELGEQLLTTRELTKSDYIHLAQAFMTTSKWSEANDLADKNISKNIEVTKWSLIKAAALQNLGKVGAAYNAIKTTIINDDVGKEQQLFYINLSLSLGLLKMLLKLLKNSMQILPIKTKRFVFFKF
ncbi:hypothetical protein RS130_19435 [Paraglaciecola aquimarina]|uniref:Uncharacterized protein n=1 Tax=Paraglaciecola aquimarina TaxID=1235557 RepID=A0ABU3T0H7_9ALTE|nr:hypothetical protein [Paraglaciecola aquimarina]MDU0355765.1 hypothetical protein [Paraglaciecola aquimarina]